MAKAKKDFGDLNFERIIIVNAFRWIPAYLFEQVKDYDFSIKQLLKLGASVCSNPLTYLYVLTDEARLIKGVLWSSVDYVDEMLDVYLLSVDKAYQGEETLPAVLAFMRDLQEKERPKLLKGWGIEIKDKIRWTTPRPKAFEKAGFTRSKKVLMEFVEQGDNHE